MMKGFHLPNILFAALFLSLALPARSQSHHFRVLVVASGVKDQAAMVSAAGPFLEDLGEQNNFSVDFTSDTGQINEANLSNYQVFVMWQLAPFDMSIVQQQALQHFIEQGKGWVGIHEAGLTGKSFLDPQTPYWQWFEDLMGGVTYAGHPAYQAGTVMIEDPKHPATRHLPAKWEASDTWYEFNHSPRSHVHVLASVDEASYKPDKPMKDHPIVWTNNKYRHVIYIGMGHDPSLLKNKNYALLVRDAILWAGTPQIPIPTQKGIVWYEKNYVPHHPLNREALYQQALAWLAQPADGYHTQVTFSDPASGKIAGQGAFEVVTDPKGNPYQVKFDINITVTDTGYSFSTLHYEEKPAEKGITNEYSKIEYRWWDFKNGKPWHNEDSSLLAGLDTKTLALRASFERAMIGQPRFRALVLYENGGHHIDYSLRAKLWLNQLALDSNFTIDYSTTTDIITKESLSRYGLIIQLDYAPYAWKPDAMAAFQDYIDQGRGGWIGFHHATLLGEFDGYPMWNWFSAFMGGIRWKDYIARFARATVHVEDHQSPIMAGVPDSFAVQKEEWYTYDKSPRPNVHVIAHVDESSYFPDTAIKMGDHPVIWTNEHIKARNLYMFMGHSPILFDDTVYKRIFTNAIFWAAEKPKPSFKVLALYTTTVESDHVDFARDAILFYSRMAAAHNFQFDTTTNWANLNESNLKNYQAVVWLNDFPQNEQQRTAFQHYMENGGGWIGFHVAGYNDSYTHWPWFVHFFGGSVFYNNSWPPLPAKLIVDDTTHVITRGIPGHYVGTPNEWYGWKPSPRLNKDVKVLVTLDPGNYPLGKKDQIPGGDIPVVWTNTRYHMLYMNMGHGDAIFTDPVQNKMFENAILWAGGAAR